MEAEHSLIQLNQNNIIFLMEHCEKEGERIEENTCWGLSFALMILPNKLLLVKGLVMIESNMLMMSSFMHLNHS